MRATADMRALFVCVCVEGLAMLKRIYIYISWYHALNGGSLCSNAWH